MCLWFSFYIASSSSGLDCSIILHCIAGVFMLRTEFHMCLIIELYGLQIENTHFYYVTYTKWPMALSVVLWLLPQAYEISHYQLNKSSVIKKTARIVSDD